MLRRLADHCEQGSLRSSTLADIFIPLVGNYIMSTTSIDHHLVNDAILATGRMPVAKHLSWGAYHGLIQKYLKLSRVRDESERVYVRALVALKSVALSSKSTARIADPVNLRLLLNHFEKYDATTDDNTRIPISIGIVTVAKSFQLPQAKPKSLG